VAFNFFGERERTGLEERAIYAVEERFDEHSETVLAAIDYLGRIGATEAIPVLREVAESEERRFLTNTIRALGRIGGAASGRVADDMAEYLVEFYEDRDLDSGPQREIILALGTNGSAAAVEFLSAIADNSESGQFLRIASLESLSQIGNPRGLDAVLASVSAGEPHVRAAAVQALGPFSGSAVDAAILDAFRDSHERTRIAAAHASRDRRLVAAVPYLRFRATRDESQAVREHSIRALGAIDNSESMQVIEELFIERRNSARVRTTSGDAYAKQPGPVSGHVYRGNGRGKAQKPDRPVQQLFRDSKQDNGPQYGTNYPSPYGGKGYNRKILCLGNRRKQQPCKSGRRNQGSYRGQQSGACAKGNANA